MDEQANKNSGNFFDNDLCSSCWLPQSPANNPADKTSSIASNEEYASISHSRMSEFTRTASVGFDRGRSPAISQRKTVLFTNVMETTGC